VGPPLQWNAVDSPPRCLMARETLIPPPPGSLRGWPQRNLWPGNTFGTAALKSTAGFMVMVRIEFMRLPAGRGIPPPSRGDAEAVRDRGAVGAERVAEYPRHVALRSDLHHAVELVRRELALIVPDRGDARPAAEQVHEKNLRLHGIVRAVGAHAVGVPREEDIVDGVFF
jgi:hypothetical protein